VVLRRVDLPRLEIKRPNGASEHAGKAAYCLWKTRPFILKIFLGDLARGFDISATGTFYWSVAITKRIGEEFSSY
jgi:hypothetical protein